MIYIDSSILLELYLGQDRAREAQAVLTEDAPKVASWLLAMEVPIVLRRLLPSPAQRPMQDEALRRFDADLRGIALYDGMPQVAERIRSDGRLAECRTLDAIHAATALLLANATRHSLRVASFDERLNGLVRAVGLEAVCASRSI